MYCEKDHVAHREIFVLPDRTALTASGAGESLHMHMLVFRKYGVDGAPHCKGVDQDLRHQGEALQWKLPKKVQ